MLVNEMQLSRFIDEQKVSMIEKAFGKKNFQTIETFSKLLKFQKLEDYAWMTSQGYASKLVDACHELHEVIEASKSETKFKRISHDSIEQLKSRVDIVDVINEYLPLKKAGSSYQACCPFHGEDTPSFKVSPTRNTYHCFGCAVGGDAIKFVMEFDRRSFPEAVEEVARIINFTLEYEDGSESAPQTYAKKRMVAYERNMFEKFDSEREPEVIDFEAQIPDFETFDVSHQAKLIFTAIYHYSLHTKQWGKEKFYKSRGIDLNKDTEKTRLIKNEIGYLYKTDIPNLMKLLTEDFGEHALVMNNIMNDASHPKSPFGFKHHTEEGFCVIPNRDPYSNLITGLKLRNTKLADWQSKSMKEPEMSGGRIAMPWPFALRREHLLNKELKFRMFEGSVDMLSIPEKKGCVDVPIPGINGLSKPLYGLFEGRTVELWYDQDRAGRRGVFGYYRYKLKSGRTIKVLALAILNKEKLDSRYKAKGDKVIGVKEAFEQAGATVTIKQWNKKIGSDVNEVLQNGNISLIENI